MNDEEEIFTISDVGALKALVLEVDSKRELTGLGPAITCQRVTNDQRRFSRLRLQPAFVPAFRFSDDIHIRETETNQDHPVRARSKAIEPITALKNSGSDRQICEATTA